MIGQVEGAALRSVSLPVPFHYWVTHSKSKLLGHGMYLSASVTSSFPGGNSPQNLDKPVEELRCVGSR